MDTDETLQLSGLQHYAFCPRQWGLIHVEGLWQENLHTVEGALQHGKAHDQQAVEKRGALLIVRGMRVRSARLQVSGACDVVEFREDERGVSLRGRKGRYLPYPVEYKHGAPKDHDADRLQVCAQSMCLEEMLCCDIPEAALFYETIRRRETVTLDASLRGKTEQLLSQMRDLLRRGYTPQVKPSAKCKSCSMAELCLPTLIKAENVSEYLDRRIREEP